MRTGRVVHHPGSRCPGGGATPRSAASGDLDYPVAVIPSRVRPVASLVLSLVLAGLVAACGSSPSESFTPSVSNGPTPAATVATPSPTQAPTQPSAAPDSPGPSASPADEEGALRAIAADVAAIRALTWKTPMEPRVIDEAELRRILLADFEKSGAASRLRDVEALYRGLGAMEGGRSLEELYLDALGSQALGFYRHDDRTLYIVQRSGGLGPVEEYTAAHELTHALQDQRFGLKDLGLDATEQSDRTLGALSLVEGDASLAGLYWSQKNLSLADLGEIIQAASEPAAQEALDALPPLVREILMFPYVQGLEFVMGLQTTGGWGAVDAVYAKPPESTEQVLHPDKYREGEEPVDVALPEDLAARLGDGWSLAYEDTLGELGLRTWLAQANAAEAANAAAVGWGGDRVGLYRGLGGAWAIVLRTAWDDTAAAQRFTSAAGPVVAGLPHASLVVDAQGPVVIIGSDAAVLTKLEGLVGG